MEWRRRDREIVMAWAVRLARSEKEDVNQAELSAARLGVGAVVMMRQRRWEILEEALGAARLLRPQELQTVREKVMDI